MEFDVEVVRMLLSDAAHTQLSQDLFIVGIIWFAMRNKVKSHFEIIETSLKSMTENIKEVSEALLKLEQTHLARFKSVEDNLAELGSRVVALEEEKKDGN